MGVQIAETMTEIFEGLPPGHSLFEQFSFIGAEELQEFEAILRRRGRGERNLKGEDRTRLLSLPLAYIEPRHRLGLLDDESDGPDRGSAGASFGKSSKIQPPKGSSSMIPSRYCAAAPLRDNLLFGRISYQVANARHPGCRGRRGSRPRARIWNRISSGSASIIGRHRRPAALAAGAGERQPGPLSREASRYSRHRRGAGPFRRGPQPATGELLHGASRATKPVHGPAE